MANNQSILYTGIAASSNNLYIGDCNGNIHLIQLRNSGDSSLAAQNINHKSVLINIGQPVTALEIHNKHLFAGTDTGVLTVIDVETKTVVNK